MMFQLIVVLSFALSVSVVLGRRKNQRLAQQIIGILENHFQPVTTKYAMLGRGIGYGFDYTLDGVVREVQGVLTLLPRHTVLYLPIARLRGREDLLKLTFHCGDTLSAGVGALVHTNCPGSWWSSVEHDEEWREERLSLNGADYQLYFYNPIVAERLRSILPALERLPNLNQLAVDSRHGKITVFLTPRPGVIRQELQELGEIVFSLTSP